jgi:hypothetical protein
MTDNSGLDYQAIQDRIEQQLRKEKQIMQLFFFLGSLAFYVGFLVIGWGLFLNNGGQPPSANIPGAAKVANPLGDAMMLLTIAGFVPLMLQAITLVMSTRRGERQMRDRIAGRIMQAEMKKNLEALSSSKDKPKRSMRLTDDGELEEVTDDENLKEFRHHAK